MEVHHEGYWYEHHDQDGDPVWYVGDGPEGGDTDDPWDDAGLLHRVVLYPDSVVIRGGTADHVVLFWDLVVVTYVIVSHLNYIRMVELQIFV